MNNTFPRLTRTDRNFYFSPGSLEYSTGILEQNNVKLYQNSLPPRQKLVAPNYYLQNEGDFGQNFSGANYFDRESAELQRLELYQKENGTDKASDTEINYQQEKEKPNDENVLLVSRVLLMD